MGCIARLHDREQDVDDFVSHTEARWLDSDITFVARIELYLERILNPDYVDSFTKRKPSAESRKAAKVAVSYFIGEAGFLGNLVTDGVIPPKAEKKGITMKRVRELINERKQNLRKDEF